MTDVPQFVLLLKVVVMNMTPQFVEHVVSSRRTIASCTSVLTTAVTGLKVAIPG